MSSIIRKNLLSIILSIVIIVMGVEIIYLIYQNRSLRLMIEAPQKFYQTLKQNDEVMPFTGKDINGNEINVEYSQTQSNKVMFWFSSTCYACEDNLNFWKDLYRDYNSDKIQLFGICGDDPADVQIMINNYNLNFPVICLDDHLIIDVYKGNILPQTIIITPQGYVQNVWPGSLKDVQKEKITTVLKYINSLTH